MRRQPDSEERVRDYPLSPVAGNQFQVLEDAARGTENVLPAMKQAFSDYATIGEVFSRLRAVWGRYRPTADF